jgi:hypothetical protein
VYRSLQAIHQEFRGGARQAQYHTQGGVGRGKTPHNGRNQAFGSLVEMYNAFAEVSGFFKVQIPIEPVQAFFVGIAK